MNDRGEGPISVDKAIEIIRRDFRESLGMDVEEYAQSVMAAADGWSEARAALRGLEDALRERGLSDAEVRIVRRRALGDVYKAFRALAKALS